MAWSNQLHILIPPRVILAVAPVVTQSGAFLMRQICSLRWSFWASFDYRIYRSAKATNSVRKMMQLALHNYSHSGLPQLICAWTPHPTILPILGLQNRSLRAGRTGLSRQVWNPKAWQKSDDKPWYTLLQIQVAYLLATSCAVPCCDSLQPKQYRKPKPDAWVVCNEAGQAVFGNFRPWNLQQVLVPTVTSAEGEGFFGSRSFLRSMIHRTEPFSCYMFLAVRGFFRMICLIHNLPNTCLVGFKSLFHGSTFPVEEQVWKWGGASWHASIVTNHLSPPLSFYPTKRTCLCSDLWLHWHAEHVNSRTRVYVGSTRKQNSKIPLTLTVWTCLNRILTPTYHGDAMAKYGNGFNPLTLLIYSAVAIWCRWDSFNLCWSLASSWMNIQSSTNPQSAKSANSQTLWALEHKYFESWNTAEDFMLTDFNMTRRLGSFAGASKVLYQ